MLSLSLSVLETGVALLLGDKETQLSLAAALDGTLASIVPVFTSGANVSPREGLLDPPQSHHLHVLPPAFCLRLALQKLCLWTAGSSPSPFSSPF